MPASGAGSARTTVVITDSFTPTSRRDVAERMPAASRRTFNQTLPDGARGIFIGTEGYFDLFVVKSGDNTGDVTPYFGIAGGIIHPIAAKEIVNTQRYSTDAPNIVIEY